jgi:large subunit ribosomal protein L22
MREFIAKSKYLRGSPRKARLVVDAVRGMNAEFALDTLKYMPHRAAVNVYKVVKSALANAGHNHGVQTNDLVISAIHVDPAPIIKRGRAESKGRYRQILKRNSHITVHLADPKDLTGKVEEAATEVKPVAKAKKAAAKVEEAEVVAPKKTVKPKAKAAPKAEKAPAKKKPAAKKIK